MCEYANGVKLLADSCVRDLRNLFLLLITDDADVLKDFTDISEFFTSDVSLFLVPLIGKLVISS